MKRIPKEEWKERFFSFLRYLPADEARVNRFWEQHNRKIKKWYLDKKQENDVIVSASPVFLLGPISRKLGVSLIATEVDPASGRFSGLNCSGKEKVRRFSFLWHCNPLKGDKNTGLWKKVVQMPLLHLRKVKI